MDLFEDNDNVPVVNTPFEPVSYDDLFDDDYEDDFDYYGDDDFLDADPVNECDCSLCRGVNTDVDDEEDGW
jgi:hypothetical protein